MGSNVYKNNMYSRNTKRPRNSIEAYIRNLVVYSQLSSCGSGVLVYAFSPTERICASVIEEGTDTIKAIAFIGRFLYNNSLDRVRRITI